MMGEKDMDSDKFEMSADERITKEITDTLMWDPDIDASAVEVRSEDGVVTLTGTVDDGNMKATAEVDARVVTGVKAVHNKLIIDPSGRDGIGEKQKIIRPSGDKNTSVVV
jgi:osmotically-inducible protein OsmY